MIQKIEKTVPDSLKKKRHFTKFLIIFLFCIAFFILGYFGADIINRIIYILF